MKFDPFQLSLETLLAASPLLGHYLEDRSRIRDAQDETLLRDWQDASTRPLRNPAQQGLFCVAPLDILVEETGGGKRFHVIELNGTGIGGMTNMTADAVAAVLASLMQMSLTHWAAEAVVLVAVSGRESDHDPRLNRLIHEKLLFAEALKRGFEVRGGRAAVTSLPHVLHDPAAFHNGRPTVVVGYIKEFLKHLKLEPLGRLSLGGRLVTGAVNDRFCLNVLSQFAGQVDLNRFVTMNRCFLAGADKGVCYDLLNDYVARRPHPCLPDQVLFAHAHSRDDLVGTVLDWVGRGRRAVIKPHGTGVGHGIEFFLSPDEPHDSIVARIDRSLQTTEQFYCVAGGALPYTVCEFIDACTVPRTGHPLGGHKYELRVVVYRDGMELKAFPSIVKISCERYDAGGCDHAGLINNITASSSRKQAAGADYMLPLTNRATLETLGLTVEQMQALCSVSTGYVLHILDEVQRRPQCFGLPATRRKAAANYETAFRDAA